MPEMLWGKTAKLNRETKGAPPQKRVRGRVQIRRQMAAGEVSIL